MGFVKISKSSVFVPLYAYRLCALEDGGFVCLTQKIFSFLSFNYINNNNNNKKVIIEQTQKASWKTVQLPCDSAFNYH